ncbi:MAG: RRXRR domain-containing protein [Nostoc sp.]|uniref:RRXRR domain-containing protein n=1 Tax=Nostoc sp. TaxID=1180 RepID=UPI002FF6BAF6
MSNFVFVLDTNKQLLNPILPGQARRLLNMQQAAVYRRYPFTIILKYAVTTPVEPHQLKIDPGSKITGLAIVQGEKVIWGAELTHRGQQIKNDLESRRAIRHRTPCKTFFGFQTGDMVRAVIPTGKFAGTHVGRLTVRESGVFEMKTPMGKVSPVRYKYCKSIHRNDG